MKYLFTINIGLRFLLESFNIIVLIAIGLMQNRFPLNIFFGILLPSLCLCIWSIFIAPQSKVKVSVIVKFLLELSIFCLVYSYLSLIVTVTWTIIYIIVVIVNSILAKVGDRLYPSVLVK